MNKIKFLVFADLHHYPGIFYTNAEEKLEKIKALADKMYSRMAYLTSDTRAIRQAMDEYHQFVVNEYHKEEPVSEDLEEAAKTYAKKESHGYEPCNIVKTFRVGAKWQKQQMMKNGVDAKITLLDGISYVSKDVLSQFRPGEKVKLIIIKEEEQ